MVSIKDVQQLREETQMPIMQCKKALEEAKGNKEKAKKILGQKGVLRAEKKQENSTKSGTIGFYIHSNKKIGSLVALRCETDSVAKNEDFVKLAHDIAMQVVATNPLYLSSTTIPQKDLEEKKAEYEESIKEEKKPPEIQEKIIEGKLAKWFQEVCLEDQPFIRDDSKTIKIILKEAIAKFGEKIEIERFTRLAIL